MARPLVFFATLLALTPVVFAFSLGSGSLGLSWADTFSALAQTTNDSVARDVLWNLRVPRALNAFTTGGVLALAGALMQVLLRNPLAEPYILGVSGGAAVAALAALWLGAGLLVLGASAFGGALTAMVLVFAFAHGKGAWTSERLLLTGVVLAAGWSAMIGLILSLAPDANLRGMLFWLMGDLSYAESAWPGVVLLAVGLLCAYPVARDLNVLALGELQAAALGVRTRALRIAIYFLASLLAAGAVTLAGSIGFIGLIAPHLARLLGGSDHRRVLPGAILIGGNLLLLADTLARNLVAPLQLPVGAITALLGVPMFIFLLQQRARRS